MNISLRQDDGISKAGKVVKLLHAGINRGRGCMARVRCIYANLGDIVIAEAVETAFKNFIFIDYSPNSKLGPIYSLVFPRRHFFDDFCVGGGTLIFSSLTTPWSLSLQDLMKRGTNFLFTFGTGVRDPEFFKDVDHSVEKTWLGWLEQCQNVSVRGPMSLEILRARGIKNVEIVGDPALIYSRNNICIKSKNKRIGLNISQNHQFFGDSKSHVLKVFVDLIKYLLQNGWDVTLFPACSEDVQLGRMLVEDTVFGSVHIFENYWNPSAYMDLLEKQDIFVGTKLHSVILSYCVYTPALMIAYQPKCFDFIETMGIKDLIIRADSLDLKQLIRKLDEIYGNLENIQRQQFFKCQEFKNIQKTFAERIFNFERNR